MFLSIDHFHFVTLLKYSVTLQCNSNFIKFIKQGMHFSMCSFLVCDDVCNKLFYVHFCNV